MRHHRTRKNAIETMSNGNYVTKIRDLVRGGSVHDYEITKIEMIPSGSNRERHGMLQRDETRIPHINKK